MEQKEGDVQEAHTGYKHRLQGKEVIPLSFDFQPNRL